MLDPFSVVNARATIETRKRHCKGGHTGPLCCVGLSLISEDADIAFR
jgi:hypothetical protein